MRTLNFGVRFHFSTIDFFAKPAPGEPRRQLNPRVACRDESKRVEARMEGAPLVKIMRPDLKVVWEYRPTTKKITATR